MTGRTVPLLFWTGTSGYNYPEWKGCFYPADLPAAKMLNYYAARFDTVEINYTFYRMPADTTLRRWAATTPDHFRFALKATRQITHERRLQNVAPPTHHLWETAQGALGSKLGPILFQLPPSLRRDDTLLEDFLRLLPAGSRAAIEFRHPSWFHDAILRCLARADVALCIADTDDGTTALEATASFGYVRLRCAHYPPAVLRRWAAKLRALGKRWEDAYVYFKHEAEGRGPAFALAFGKSTATGRARARGRSRPEK